MEFVYKLVKISVPFYVGITNNPNARLQHHLTRNSKVQEMLEEGITPKMEIIEIVETREEAKQREKFWILEYLAQGFPLVNIQLTLPSHHEEEDNYDEEETLEDISPKQGRPDVKQIVVDFDRRLVKLFYTPQEAQAILGMNRDTFNNHVRRGSIKRYTFVGPHGYFNKSEIEALVEKSEARLLAAQDFSHPNELDYY